MRSCEVSVNTKKADAGSAATSADCVPSVSVDAGVTQLIDQALACLPLDKASGLVVAYSGGVDSHVLLKCVADWCQSRTAPTGETLSLRAHHIDHALQAESSAWAAHCDSVCRQLQVELTTTRVLVDLQSGFSPEDAARRARYDALRADLRNRELLLLAHHADDQAETLLLQLFRGAGVNGLASMPAYAVFGRGHLARPMLQVTADRVRDFAKHRRLQWIEDPSNLNDGFDRNLLRNQVMPLLKARWPSIATSISRSASHCADAATINRIFTNGVLGELIDKRVLPIRTLAAYSITENKTMLRCWIEHHGFSMPSTGQLNHLLSDLLSARHDSAGELMWGNACIRKYRDSLYLGTRADFQDCKPFCYDWPELQQSLAIMETGQVLTRQDIPDVFAQGAGGLVVRSRQGGERIRLAGHPIHKSVKNLFQECSIPPWKRNHLPFIYRGDILIGIIGIGFTD